MNYKIRLKGGVGSGHHGHKGIPGHRGGSLPRGESFPNNDSLPRGNSYLDIIRRNSDKFIIDRTGMFGQDFHSKDGRVKVEYVRNGGGFMQGTTSWEVTIDGVTTDHSTLSDVYAVLINKLNLK